MSSAQHLRDEPSNDAVKEAAAALCRVLAALAGICREEGEAVGREEDREANGRGEDEEAEAAVWLRRTAHVLQQWAAALGQ